MQIVCWPCAFGVTASALGAPLLCCVVLTWVYAAFNSNLTPGIFYRGSTSGDFSPRVVPGLAAVAGVSDHDLPVVGS